MLGAPGKVLTGVDFDLKNSANWEAVLEGVDPFEHSAAGGAEHKGGHGEEVEGEGAAGGGGDGEGGEGGEGGGDPDSAVVEMPPSWVGQCRLTPA